MEPIKITQNLHPKLFRMLSNEATSQQQETGEADRVAGAGVGNSRSRSKRRWQNLRKKQQIL